MKLSIVIPACNEEGRIRRMLDAYLPYFAERYGDDVEFVVVVNNSTDATEHIIAEYREKWPCVRCVSEVKNIGKGGALMLGFREASGELVGFSDADGSTPPSAFAHLIDGIGDAGAIIASRWRRESEVSPKQPLPRRIVSRVFNLLVRALFGLNLTDTQCGAKLMRRTALMRVLPDLGITRWAFDVDLLFQMKRAGFRIAEVPTVWRHVEGSKVEIFRTSVDMLAALTRLRLIYSPLKWIVTVYDRYVGPFLHPPGMERDHLLRHSMLMMSGSVLANALNVFFQAMIAYMLKDNLAEYGDMSGMLGAFLVISLPLSALCWMMSHFTAGFIKDGKSEKAKSMLLGLGRDMSLVAVPVLIMMVLGREWLADFFNLRSSLPVIVMAVAVFTSMYRPLTVGVLNGAQAFAWTTGVGVSWSFMRVVFGAVLVGLGFSAIGALSAHAVACVIALLISLWAVHIVVPGAVKAARDIAVYAYLFKMVIPLVCFSVLAYADVMIVKHFFLPDEAGRFCMSAMVARTVFFAPVPIIIAMFPKVVSAGDASYGSYRTLLKALSLVAAVVFLSAGFCTVFPELILRVMTNTTDHSMVPLVRSMVWALSPLAIVHVFMNFELAQRRFRVTIPLLLCTVLYVVGVGIWHESVLQIVWVLGGVNILAMILVFLCLPWQELRQKKVQ